MSAQDSASAWYIAGTGSGTVDYPTASHGVTATFASSTMSGRRVILDFVEIVKVGATGDDLIFVDGAGSTIWTLTTVANAAASANRTNFTPNGIEMGSGFGVKLTQTDWKFLIGYRLL